MSVLSAVTVQEMLKDLKAKHYSETRICRAFELEPGHFTNAGDIDEFDAAVLQMVHAIPELVKSAENNFNENFKPVPLLCTFPIVTTWTRVDRCGYLN